MMQWPVPPGNRDAGETTPFDMTYPRERLHAPGFTLENLAGDAVPIGDYRGGAPENSDKYIYYQMVARNGRGAARLARVSSRQGDPQCGAVATHTEVGALDNTGLPVNGLCESLENCR